MVWQWAIIYKAKFTLHWTHSDKLHTSIIHSMIFSDTECLIIRAGRDRVQLGVPWGLEPVGAVHLCKSTTCLSFWDVLFSRTKMRHTSERRICTFLHQLYKNFKKKNGFLGFKKCASVQPGEVNGVLLAPGLLCEHIIHSFTLITC